MHITYLPSSSNIVSRVLRWLTRSATDLVSSTVWPPPHVTFLESNASKLCLTKDRACFRSNVSCASAFWYTNGRILILICSNPPLPIFMYARQLFILKVVNQNYLVMRNLRSCHKIALGENVVNIIVKRCLTCITQNLAVPMYVIICT